MLKIFLLKLLEAKLGRMGNWLAGRQSTGPAIECGDGCYELSDGTPVPLGDLGIVPRAYNLKP